MLTLVLYQNKGYKVDHRPWECLSIFQHTVFFFVYRRRATNITQIGTMHLTLNKKGGGGYGTADKLSRHFCLRKQVFFQT